MVLFEMSPNVLDIVHDLVILLPIEHTLWLVGGSCRNLPVCSPASIAKSLSELDAHPHMFPCWIL